MLHCLCMYDLCVIVAWKRSNALLCSFHSPSWCLFTLFTSVWMRFCWHSQVQERQPPQTSIISSWTELQQKQGQIQHFSYLMPVIIIQGFETLMFFVILSSLVFSSFIGDLCGCFWSRLWQLVSFTQHHTYHWNCAVEDTTNMLWIWDSRFWLMWSTCCQSNWMREVGVEGVNRWR